MPYVDQAHKNNALRSLADAFQANADYVLSSDPVLRKQQEAQQGAYQSAARRLREILDIPVAVEPKAEPEPDPNVLHMAFQPEDMCVVVVAPPGALGGGRALTFDRSTRDFMREDGNVDRWTKLVAAALLRDALDQLGG
jgi:hypothetical protein